MRIALLGCTGQIGRCLIRALAATHELMLYARRPHAMQSWLTPRGYRARVFNLTDFPGGEFDLIINAIGDGVPEKINALGSEIVETTEYFDGLCLDHLDRNSTCAYIFLSTGRIYGEDYKAAQDPHPNPLPIKQFTTAESYPLAKREAEIRHRKRSGQRIGDIRIFGYVSDEIGLEDDFLVAQMLSAFVADVVFTTTSADFVRDYVGAEDLAELIDRLLTAGVPNGEYDIYSACPTTKFEMLRALTQEFGLRYAIKDMQEPVLCHDRPKAISRQTAARRIGYLPRRTSLENVLASAEAIWRREGKPDRRCAL